MSNHRELLPELKDAEEIGVLKPLPAPLNDLFFLLSDLNTLSEDCNDCASGTHPELSPSTKSLIDTLLLLLIISSDQNVLGGPRDGIDFDGAEIRRAVTYAFPAFIYLVDVLSSYSSFQDVATYHPELHTLRDKLYEAYE